jgi:hypothetical protein
VDNEFEKVWKEAIVSWYLSAGTEEYHEIPESQPVPGRDLNRAPTIPERQGKANLLGHLFFFLFV